MQLGDLVAKSYVVNKTGFHSTLTSHDSANVSNVTNGMHNFWVGAYVNLVSKVDGDGKLFNKDSQNLFKDKKRLIRSIITMVTAQLQQTKIYHC